MFDSTEYLLTFSSTHHALRAEDVLKQAEIALDIVPIPQAITAECGLALTFAKAEEEKVRALIIKNKIEYKACYFLGEGNLLIEKKDFGGEK